MPTAKSFEKCCTGSPKPRHRTPTTYGQHGHTHRPGPARNEKSPSKRFPGLKFDSSPFLHRLGLQSPRSEAPGRGIRGRCSGGTASNARWPRTYGGPRRVAGRATPDVQRHSLQEALSTTQFTHELWEGACSGRGQSMHPPDHHGTHTGVPISSSSEVSFPHPSPLPLGPATVPAPTIFTRPHPPDGSEGI